MSAGIAVGGANPERGALGRTHGGTDPDAGTDAHTDTRADPHTDTRADPRADTAAGGIPGSLIQLRPSRPSADDTRMSSGGCRMTR
jgi:hypothetical protein